MTNIDMNVEREPADAELTLVDLDAVSGGECTTSFGVCKDTGGGHIVCTPTVVTCS
jgi:hypothetical protein